MSVIERHIVETDTKILKELDSSSKKLLSEELTKSLEEEPYSSNEERFFQSFGAFVSDKPAEDIVKKIRVSRKFRKKDIKF